LIGKTYNIPTTVLRFFNVYGPRQSLSNPYTGVAAIFMSRIKNGNRPVVFEDGRQTRDFIYVEDIARACAATLANRKTDYRVFNLGSGKPLTIAGMAESIARAYGRDIKPEIRRQYRKGDVRHCYADTRQIRLAMGFRPAVSFAEGIRRLIEWAGRRKPATCTLKPRKNEGEEPHMTTKVSLVIPAKDEAATIGMVLKDITPSLPTSPGMNSRP